MSGPASLRGLCATAPLAIRRPAPGTPLHLVCEASYAEPWPKDLDGFTSAAREIVDRRPGRTGLSPLSSELAYDIDVVRCANLMMDLRLWHHAQRDSLDRHEGFAVFFTVYMFHLCGGRFGPGDHTAAHERAAEYLGVGASDVAGAVTTYTAATCQLAHDDAYGRWGQQPAECYSACLRVMSDLAVSYWHLLDHSHANARLTADIAADHDARYQPCVEDLEYARS